MNPNLCFGSLEYTSRELVENQRNPRRILKSHARSAMGTTLRGLGFRVCIEDLWWGFKMSLGL